MKRLIAPVLLVAMAVASIAMIVTRSVQAQASTIIFTAQMFAANEVAPVVVNATETAANGLATVTLDIVSSGGTITSAVSRFDVSMTGLASNSVIILSHIHEGSAAVNGPVRVDSGLSPAAPVPANGGSTSYSRSNLATSPAVAQGIINNPAGWYFNVHTALSPGGVARGQLVRQTVQTLNAPTLGEWGMILMTLIITALGIYFLTARGKAALSGADESIAMSAPVRAINWKLFATVALIVEVIAAAILVALRAGAVDTLGALTSGLIVAFIIHLFIGNARRH